MIVGFLFCLLGMLNIDIRIPFFMRGLWGLGLLGMLNIDIRILEYPYSRLLFRLLGMLNIDIRIQAKQ